MRHLHNKLLLSLLLLLPTLTLALPSDREQPIEIEADHAQLDDEQGITQYKGRAILTQGSLRIEGDIITFYYDDNQQISKAIAQGNLATYQQVQKAGEEPVRAKALQMEYHAKAQKIYLIGKSQVWKDGDEFSGNRIEYDIAKDVVNMNSAPVTVGGETQKSGRVHIIIQPPGSKKKSSTIKKSTATPKAADPAPIIDETTNTSQKDSIYPTATTTSNLNIRTGPGTQYDQLGTFGIASELIVLTKQEEWVQVRGMIDEKVVIGWVYRRYLQFPN